jgi:L,D-transpeptidase ErfK/SrfK
MALDLLPHGEELRMRALTIFLVAVALSQPASGQPPPAALGRTMTGETVEYVVSAGETFESIGDKLGVDALAIARRNTRWVHAPLVAGMKLTVDVHRTVPGGLDRGIIVSVAQNRVFLLDVESIVSMPAGVGRSAWPTPSGEFFVIKKEVNPTWDVPPSIQEEMRRLGRRVVKRIPPGPNNPLGEYWVGLSLPNLGIHGTNAPSTVPGYSTHGCIRLSAGHIKLLFERVEVGTPGVIVRQPAFLTRHDGRIFVEVQRDLYGHDPDVLDSLEAAAAYLGVRDHVDWRRVQDAIRVREGLAINVTAKWHLPEFPQHRTN